ncbi:glycogen/starch/alpha-glucan phosphorylase [Ligilactobacillus acidipiscis]|uniref:glycogen/starch/alpha-glucan phosphorylase n=1 Tax=Ligilactobacillus acidipiscis TaxID=89059 RepID=UPI0023F66187|nr:glycogen/starch/alpha-glucan phosphorylase [Ligilactobacillus acidipiscis]WEV57086.1 glycogen/starch/alpha-glucan phosphorylase [Ligilactobacillus acidipiscis]
MKVTEKKFVADFKKKIAEMYTADYTDVSVDQLYQALAAVVHSYFVGNQQETRKKYKKEDRKQVYYFSIEFLPGRFLDLNILNLGLSAVVKEGLAKLGLSYQKIKEAEPEPGLGNGGLGRLGSDFLDSAAAQGIALQGNGIRYKYGLFDQRFVNGYQVEIPDDWLRSGDQWGSRRENRACLVRFGGNVWLQPDSLGRLRANYENTQDVMAVPYDYGITGYQNGVANRMRLWSAELPNQKDKIYTIAQKEEINQITEILYPDDSNWEGQLLRLKQEYFFVSAGVQSIIRAYRHLHQSLSQLPEKIAIHINDTHPAVAVPELMRVLMDDEFLSWDHAWNITQKVMSYTNHTLMSEALETWPEEMFAQTLPRIYQIIQEIDRRFRAEMIPLYGNELTATVAPLGDGNVRMAYLAVIGSHSVNGVAKVHTELLEDSVLGPLYKMFPERFNNKTNGINLKRWLQVANPELAGLLDETIGTGWQHHPDELQKFMVAVNDQKVLSRMGAIRHEKKKQLAAFIESDLGIKVDTHAIFDVQIKRLHAYKRQLLHAMYIIDEYLQLKSGKKLAVPRVHIFGAKAAPSYHYAKQIIKLLNTLAETINNDPDIGDQLKVVFLPNYDVSLAEKIIPAADVSEQISLAGKEASGTSNMKLMANGAVTLATMDGANIEIADAVRQDNIVTFGLSVAEAENYQNYRASDIYASDPVIHRILDTLVDGTFANCQTEGQAIFDSLVKYNDQYLLLADYQSYKAGQARIDSLYLDRNSWYNIAAINVSQSGKFSSDYTIERYAEEIWQVKIEQSAQ